MLRCIMIPCAAMWATLSAFADRFETTAGAKITAPLQVENVTPLFFGEFSPGAVQDGTVMVKRGKIQCSDAITLLSSDQTPAEFHVAGQVDAVYTVDVPVEATMTSSLGGTLTASLFPVAPGHLAGGQDTFFVNASLDVPARQTTDIYQGSFTVTVSYQ